MKSLKVFIVLLLAACFVLYSMSLASKYEELIAGTWYLGVAPWLTFEFKKDHALCTYRGTERDDLLTGTYAFISRKKILVELVNEEGEKTVHELSVLFPKDDVLVLLGFDDLLREKRFKRLEEVTDGIERRYFESGILYSACAYKNGMLDGVCKGYHLNGALFFEKHYKKGKLNGMRRLYYKNGQLMDESEYANGVLHGLVKLYRDNGILAAELPFKDGSRQGLAKYYDEEGNLIRQETYRNGELIHSLPL